MKKVLTTLWASFFFLLPFKSEALNEQQYRVKWETTVILNNSIPADSSQNVLLSIFNDSISIEQANFALDFLDKLSNNYSDSLMIEWIKYLLPFLQKAEIYSTPESLRNDGSKQYALVVLLARFLIIQWMEEWFYDNKDNYCSYFGRYDLIEKSKEWSIDRWAKDLFFNKVIISWSAEYMHKSLWLALLELWFSN
jgi:hypothetical protein